MNSAKLQAYYANSSFSMSRNSPQSSARTGVHSCSCPPHP